MLLTYLNTLLKPEMIKDFCPNGLQVQGKMNIAKIVTGVTASEALIDAAIDHRADALFVHHGYFWKGEDPCLKGMKFNRIKKLIENEINLYAYHLPLDIHPELGNNVQLANMLGIKITGGLENDSPTSVSLKGEFEAGLTVEDIARRVESSLNRIPLVEASGPDQVKSVAWCTGGGQGYIDAAAEQGIDLFISGEVSEKTIHTAREYGMHFIAAGHHATERYGAKAVGEHLAQQFGLDVTFVDIDNPA